MPLKPNETRVTRRGPDGILYQWSNAQERPEGVNWLQASKASFPRIRTYLWFRPSSSIEQDKRNSIVTPEPTKPLSALGKLGVTMFQPFQYMKQRYDAMNADKGVAAFKANTRVSFGNQSYYTVGGVNDLDLTIKIRNPITGEIKQVNAKELTELPQGEQQYAVGDKIILAKGAIDTKEQEAMVLGFDAIKRIYKVSVGALDPKQKDIKDAVSVYPEAIDAVVPGKGAKAKDLKLEEDSFTDPTDKQVIEALYRASKSGRNSVQVRDIVNDLRAHGQPVGEHQVTYALAMLNRLDENIQYNANSGGVYLGAARPTLETLIRARSITPAQDSRFGLTNLVQDSKTDTYAHNGLRVKSDDTEGIIDSIIGGIVTVLTAERKRVELNLEDLRDEHNRKLHIDPAAPKYVGNVRNKDIFWVLRDREGVKSVKEGDSVSLLPGISNLQINKNNPISGKVLAVNSDGTVDMEAQVGTKTTRIRAFNRQLAKTPILTSAQQLQDYIHFHAKQMPGKTVRMNDTEIVFGGRNNKSITFTFGNGEDYANNEHLWFAPIAAQANPNGWESVINSLGNFWSTPNDYSTTLAPSKALLGYINEVFPNSKYVTIARDTTTTPEGMAKVEGKVQFKVTIDRNAIGKRYSLDRLYQHYGEQSLKTPMAATSLGENNTVRLETNGEHLFITLGDLFKTYQAAHLPAITLHSTEVEALNKKKREEYEANYGQHPTLYDVINSTMYNRRRAWDATPGLEGLTEKSGVFTYDEDNDRFVVDLEHYDDAHAFLKGFLGTSMYESYVFETKDKGYYAYGSHKILNDVAVPHIAQRNQRLAAKEDRRPLKIDGFYQNSNNAILRNYQNSAVRFMLGNNSSLLAMDQGTGKSLSAIAATVEKLNRLNKSDPSRKHKALIIAPASVAQTSWMNDLSRGLAPKDRHGNILPGKFNYTLLMGKDRLAGYKRLADNTDNTSIGVTSFQTFALRDWQELKDMGFDVIVLDEAQTISGADNAGIITDRMNNMLSDVVHKMALTGTPLENEPEDLQGILGWLNPETFGDKDRFMRDFVDIDYVASRDAAGRSVPRRVGVRLKNLKALRSKMNQIMFRVEKEDLVGYNEPGPNGTKAIPFSAADSSKFNAYVKRYKSPETDEVTKTRLGELSVVPTKSIFPQYSIIRDPATKKMRINVTSPYGPVTMDDYPEYKQKVERAKAYMKADYQEKLARGERPGTHEYLFRMQQVLNDPTLLAKKYGAEFAEPVRNPKLDRLYSHISEHFGNQKFNKNENGKIIVFAEHVETLKLLEERLSERFPQLRGKFLKYVGQGHAIMKDQKGMKTRTDVETAFNKDPKFNYPIMLASNAAKTGVNLPAANMVINYDIGWNPQDINQRIDRAHRIRSLKDIVSSNTAPARDVTAHMITVGNAEGDVNYSVEARKLFSHSVKKKIFDTFIRGGGDPGYLDKPDELNITDDGDHQKITEELLNVTNPEGVDQVDPERARKYRRTREDQRKRNELIRKYGHMARYVKDFPR